MIFNDLKNNETSARDQEKRLRPLSRQSRLLLNCFLFSFSQVHINSIYCTSVFGYCNIR